MVQQPRHLPGLQLLPPHRHGPRHARQFKGHAHYERTEEFVALYDNPAFDAKAETLPISEFEPMLRRVFAQPKQSLYKAAVDARRPADANPLEKKST